MRRKNDQYKNNSDTIVVFSILNYLLTINPDKYDLVELTVKAS